jgi:hypothetical protein
MQRMTNLPATPPFPCRYTWQENRCTSQCFGCYTGPTKLTASPQNWYEPSDTGTGALDNGEPQTVTLSGREYERYLCGWLNDGIALADQRAAEEREAHDRALDLDHNGNRCCLGCDAFVRPNATAVLSANKALAVANEAIAFAAREARKIPDYTSIFAKPQRRPRSYAAACAAVRARTQADVQSCGICHPHADAAEPVVTSTRVVTVANSAMFGALLGWLAPALVTAAIIALLAAGYWFGAKPPDPLAGHSDTVRRMMRRW